MIRGLLLLLAMASLAAAEPPHLLSGSRSLALDRMERVGRAPADMPLENITVVLGLRDGPGLDGVIAAQGDRRSPRYHRWLDAAEIADRFGPRRAEYDAVRRWLVEQGFTVVRESPYRLMLVVAGTAAEAEAAFATPIALFRRGNRVYHGPVADPAVPPEMAGMVAGVIGLDDVPQFRPLALLANGDTALTPADFAAAYDIAGLQASGLTGAGHSIAVIARSDFLDSDIAAFSSRFLPRPLAPVRVFAGTPPGILPDEGEQIEVLLDTQWAGALAPGATLNVVIGSTSGTGGGVSQALETAITNRAEGQPNGDVITISFGFCELDAAPLETEFFDYLYSVANAQGQTVVVASGDDGPEECLPDKQDIAVNGLASSPHAVAVGGTAFALDASGNVPPGVPDETVWNDHYGASGGGRSVILGMPRYQLAAGLSGLGTGRLLPDVALAASPGSPGYVIVQDGGDRVVGGTSASAPAFASVLALLNEHLAATRGVSGGLGQLLPDLYRLGSSGAPVFRDVTTGTNGGFPAGPGFDLATGWGAPLAGALADAIDGPARCEPLIDAVHPERGCLVPTGRGAHACGVEWLVEQDAFALAGQLPAEKQTCRDGDPACDADGTANGQCTLRVALCVNVFDFRMFKTNPNQRKFPLRCHPGKTRRLRLVEPRARTTDPVAAANRGALQQAIGALPLPTGLSDTCTATVPIVVPAGGVLPLRARAGGSLGSPTARLTLECTP